ncbi:hypothetical protein [Kosakonia cowanii]|jgi:DNA invertase Pin-like site-specific DNA recombinase|uniref:hypothetical protein n=1 Tax=Kosakonia cowanii TaxID=208223 RepID=UPI00111CF725|nr:hypothetical protein [Kosakonia cowanii]MDP9769253.1 DNA invertase Pin-like site-specific DNA recombinase [Atlantibacter hermannii]TPD63400.1 hypothetical protein FJP70_15620 [Kosakonia cowanii]TPD87134.1 hypothetical protein FJP67_15630 [Kosakonia cowanii]TPE03212.1 hypothetical protein FJP64_15645 [Kosakonia cowanii]WPG20729.1 hypothetical protein SD435_21150 [Kosakonia cowanii]
MMIESKLLELKEKLEIAGWEITNEEEILSVSDDKIEWEIFNEKISSKETLVFFLFDDLGRRTEKLSDIFYVMRLKDKVRLYINDKDDKWSRNLKEFVFTMK